MEKVFHRLAKNYKAHVKYTTNGNPYFSTNGYRVQLYNSSTGAGNTLQINTGRQIYKVRSMKSLTK